jgi:hypothetical protein
MSDPVAHPETITIAGGTYRLHKPKSAAQAATVLGAELPVHVQAAAMIGLCADCHGVPWGGKALAFGERVFDVLMGKGATFQTITTTGATLYGLTASVVLLEAEVAEVEGFTAAPQDG